TGRGKARTEHRGPCDRARKNRRSKKSAGGARGTYVGARLGGFRRARLFGKFGCRTPDVREEGRHLLAAAAARDDDADGFLFRDRSVVGLHICIGRRSEPEKKRDPATRTVRRGATLCVTASGVTPGV